MPQVRTAGLALQAYCYKDVDAVLHDHRLTADRVASLHTVHAPEVPEITRAALKATLNAMILFMDPPVHTRLRNLANQAFTPHVVEALRQRIESLVHESLAPALPRGSIDLIREFAYPLAAMVIAEMLGVRREDRDLIEWRPNFILRGLQTLPVTFTAQAPASTSAN